MSSSNVPLLDDYGDIVEFGEEGGKNLRHPYVAFFHLFFRIAALVVYILCGLFSISFITSFVSVILLLSMDFWTVKNITGRLLVGLRWWNYVDKDGNSHWVFESKKGNQNQVDPSEVRTFWLALVIVPLVWVLLFIVAIFRFEFQWLLLVGTAISLSGANLYAYLKCRSQQPLTSLQNLSSNFAARVFQNMMTRMTNPAQQQQQSQSSNVVEPMQVDAPPEDNDNLEEEAHIVENPTLDLEAYANSYTGLAKLNRLKYIADYCPTLRVEALKMGLNHVMNTYNVALYKEFHKCLQETLGGGASLPDVAGGAQSTSQDYPSLDLMWVENKTKKAVLKLEKLDGDLKNYKSNSIKESIRRGHDDLGDHYLDCGDLPNALKCYSRARDYCTSGKHVVNMCLNVIKVSVYLQNWTHVLSYVNKAEATPDFLELHGKDNQSNQTIMTRLKCAAGLAELAMKKYKPAAKNFLQANLDHCEFPELLSPSNVAVYGGLCALATFDRNELQKNVILSSSFKLFLELEPQLRDIILKFYESKYASCLTLLEEMKDNLLLDMYIAPHVAKLYSQIRNRALIQYFSPYMSADLWKMASAFNTTISALEDELMQLILDGQIQARIDSHNKILYAKDVDQRSTTFEKSLQIGRMYQRRTRMLILRAAVVKNQILVRVNESPQRECSQGNDISGVAAGNSTVSSRP